MWGKIREDLEISHEVMVIKRRAIRLIEEALQVAAMCMKHKNSKGEEDKSEITCKDGICSIDWGEEK